jgi:hypothetical protein
MSFFNESKEVRFYFEVGINFVFPEKPKKYTSSDDEWITELCWVLCENINRKLSFSFDDAQFSRFKQLELNANVFTIYFTISKCHKFTSNEIWSPRKEYNGFKIKKKPLLKARESIEAIIRISLPKYYFIDALSLKYIASRDFVFEIYFGGFVTVKKKFSPKEICDGGGVSYALEFFFEEMISALEGCGLEGDITQTTARRNSNNEYVFEVSKTSYYGFSENNVAGEMALLEHNMSIDEIQMIGIENENDALQDTVTNAKAESVYRVEQCLPVGVDLLSFDFDFIDQDDDVYEVCDELQMNYADSEPI